MFSGLSQGMAQGPTGSDGSASEWFTALKPAPVGNPWRAGEP